MATKVSIHGFLCFQAGSGCDYVLSGVFSGKNKLDILLSVGGLICFSRMLFGGLLSFLFTESANRSIAAAEKVGDSVCAPLPCGAQSVSSTPP